MWKKAALSLAKSKPDWNVFRIAASIQDSPAGRKRAGTLTYSIDFIARNIRDVLARPSSATQDHGTQ